MALQQNQSLSEVLGIRPRGSTISYNEMCWWAAYRSLVPFEASRFDLHEGRILSLHTGKSVKTVTVDWFCPLDDPDYIDKLKEEMLEEQRLKKEKENGENN